MIRSLFAGLVLATLPVFASAAVLTVEYDFSMNNSAYSFGSQQMQSVEPIIGTGSFTYDLDYRVADYPIPGMTRAVFGNPSDKLGVVSPVASRLPFDPATLRLPDGAHLYASVYDSSVTVMATAYGAGYDEVSGSQYTYNFSLDWSDWLTSTDIYSPYLFSAQDVIDTYRNLSLAGAAVSVTENYTSTQAGMVSGFAWRDDNARITRVLVDGRDIMLAAASVPTPATFALLLPGLVLIGATARRRKAPHTCAC